MQLFQTIRKLFGVEVEIKDSPIETLDKIIQEENSIKSELEKAQSDFDEISFELDLKLVSCDELIKGGNTDAQYSKNAILKKIDRVTDDHLDQVSEINVRINKKHEERVALESDILKKSIDTVAMLSDDEQKEIRDRLKVWELTGEVNGEPCDSNLKAIVQSIYVSTLSKAEAEDDDDEIEMEPDEFKEEHDRLLNVLEHGTDEERKKEAKKQRKEMKKYAGKLQKADYGLKLSALKQRKEGEYNGHYANAIVRRGDKILFLKRANGKVIAPGKYCLPGGHIDDFESISEAAIRELKEEAGLTASHAYLVAKAKCQDGKWAFYLEVTGCSDNDPVMLLDEESAGAAWIRIQLLPKVI